MDIVFNFGDDEEKMQPGEKISFGKLDFIANQLENLHLQELEMPEQEEEQCPRRSMLSPPDWRRRNNPLARHLTRHSNVLTEAS